MEMKKTIIIARHGKPALDRNAPPRLTWREYRKWWASYEAGGLAVGQDVPEDLCKAVSQASKVYTSQRKRALETARAASPAIAAEINPAFNEAPLPPPLVPGKFLPRTWNILARSAWLWGHSLDDESRKEALARARLAASILEEASLTHDTVFLAAHGWFNRMIRPELQRKGWLCTHNGGDSYWSFRVYRKTF